MGPQTRKAAAVPLGPGMLPTLIRAVAGLVLLLFMLIVLPTGLVYGTIALAGQGGVPLSGNVPTLLASPDQGQLFAWALALIGWIAWGAFALSVVVEVPARLRGRVPRRLPALGWSQRSAAGLLGAIFAVLPVGAAFASAVPASTATTTATGARSAPVTGRPTDTASAVPHAATAEEPHYTVRAARPAETLWSIALAQLGDGTRWKDIALLNEGRVVGADGSVFRADAALRPGWTLAMPAAPVEVTVHAGDTLSRIADEHHLPGGWEALYAANHRVIGTDPDLIRPGQQLRLPSAPGSANGNGSGGRSVSPAVASRTAAQPQGAHPEAAHPGAVSPGAVPPELLRPEAAQLGAAAPARAPTGHRSADSTALPAVGAAGLLAAGLVGVLVRNRILQQRRRPPRRRIPMPAAEEQRYETALRAAAELTGLDLLDRTLRTLGMTCLDTGAELPALAAAALRPDGVIDLHLVDPAPAAIAPFTGPPNSRLWSCRAADADLVSAERAHDVPAPYPALVTLGHTRDGVHVLADLETARHLHLDGSPEDVAAVSRALVAELAASPLADQLRLVALGSAAPLVGRIGVDRLRAGGRPEQVLADLGGHRKALERAMADCQVEHPRAARSHGVATETWIPMLLCTDESLTPDQLDWLDWVLSGAEHRCLAAVTPAGPGAGWHLNARPGYHQLAGGLPFAVQLQRLDEDELATVLSLLATSGQAPAEPPPAWTGHDPNAEPGAYDPFVIPVLATRSRATNGADPASATAVPLLCLDTPGGFADQPVQVQVPTSAQVPLPASPTDPHPGTAPRILLLGPVQVVGASGVADPSSVGRLTALAALLALQPDPDLRNVDAVVSRVARSVALSRLRDWLGSDCAGAPYLPPASWHLHPAVTSDWADFQELYRLGMHGTGPAADSALRRALDLVRSAPFAGAHSLYPWAEPYRQDMISAIIDASHELAKRCLARGDHLGCEAALHSGLAAVPEAEILHRGLIRLYATTGRRDHVAATITQLAQLNDAMGYRDYEPETLQLFSMISGRRHP
ncbi:hypothetical protein ABIA33_003194 [Streptacidiphilus sp. MAP12-16]|uniref:LysM peptidoglycan-binding domain-containing protein n=1 Tax=Streptacidiphilus sp. MAP12-16 TaxID=3156300 RepID=UPI00351110DF